MPTISPGATANPLDRNAVSGDRMRRNFQRLLKGGGTSLIALAATGGIQNASGLSIKLASSSALSLSAAGLAVAVDGTTIEINGNNQLQVISGSSPLTTKGDLYTFSTTNARLPVGTDGYILSANSAQTTGLQWIANSGGGGASFTVTSVTGSRAVGTQYQNTTGSPVIVTASVYNSGSASAGAVFGNAAASSGAVPTGSAAGANSTTQVQASLDPAVTSLAYIVPIMVPTGWYYSVSSNIAGIAVAFWTETQVGGGAMLTSYLVSNAYLPTSFGDTGLDISLPGPGTYGVRANLRVSEGSSSLAVARLYLDGIGIVTNSERVLYYITIANRQETVGLEWDDITVSSATTLRLQGTSNAGDAILLTDFNGRSVLMVTPR